jgi:hypothetical protein
MPTGYPVDALVPREILECILQYVPLTIDLFCVSHSVTQILFEIYPRVTILWEYVLNWLTEDKLDLRKWILLWIQAVKEWRVNEADMDVWLGYFIKECQDKLSTRVSFLKWLIQQKEYTLWEILRRHIWETFWNSLDIDEKPLLTLARGILSNSSRPDLAFETRYYTYVFRSSSEVLWNLILSYLKPNPELSKDWWMKLLVQTMEWGDWKFLQPLLTMMPPEYCPTRQQFEQLAKGQYIGLASVDWTKNNEVTWLDQGE